MVTENNFDTLILSTNVVLILDQVYHRWTNLKQNWFTPFTHLKLCLATSTHNFKWVTITYIYLFNLTQHICKYRCFNTHFVPNNSEKTDYKRVYLAVNPLTAKLFNFNFHPLEVVSRWRDPQLQVDENYSDLTRWNSTLFKSRWLMSNFVFNMFKTWYLTISSLN